MSKLPLVFSLVGQNLNSLYRISYLANGPSFYEKMTLLKHNDAWKKPFKIHFLRKFLSNSPSNEFHMRVGKLSNAKTNQDDFSLPETTVE